MADEANAEVVTAMPVQRGDEGGVACETDTLRNQPAILMPIKPQPNEHFS